MPHPLPVRRLGALAGAGFAAPQVVGRRASAFQGEMYCAWLEPLGSPGQPG